MQEEFYEIEWNDVPVVPIDHKALNDGFRYFWNNGNLIAYRTSKQRVMNTGWFNFKNENSYEQ